MRIYPLTECCTIFGVNLKTLHKWLAREGIHPQRSRADTRIRYLTAEQVASLAEAYDRPLPQREESATQELRASSAAPLFVDRLDQQEQRILRLETEVRQMQASMASFQQQTSERTCVPGAADNDQQTRQTEQSEKQKADHKRQPRAKVREKTSSKKGGGKGLPRSLVLLRVFAQQHHIPLKAAARASKAGKIAVVRGRWLVNSRYATEALGTRGQQDFYILFREREGFTPCGRCPHHVAPAQETH